MNQEINFLDLSIFALKQLKHKRKLVIETVSLPLTMEAILKKLFANLKNCNQYVNYILKTTWLKILFFNLKKIESKITQQEYEKIINSMIQQIKKKMSNQKQVLNFNKINTQNNKKQSYNINLIQQQQQINQIKNKSFIRQFQQINQFQQGLDKKNKKRKINQFDNLFQYEKKDNNIQDINWNNIEEFGNILFQQKKINQRQQIQIKNGRKAQVKNKQTFQIDAKQLVVQIRQLKQGCDILNYQSNGFKLDVFLKLLIIKYLTEKTIIVRKKSNQIQLMQQQITYVKSGDAGNYRFDPFCDALEIFIKFNNQSNKKQFDKKFKVVGDIQNISFKFIELDLENWDKKLFTLGPKSQIQDIIKYICQKRQITQQACLETIEHFKKVGGAHKVEDLYFWEKNDYSNKDLQTTFIFSIMQTIQQIKDNFNIKNEFPLSKEKRQCIKIANSHKILRYVIFKLKGKQEVKKIAWINMKNLKKAIQIVKKQIHNQYLLNQLQKYFQQYAVNPNNNSLQYSRGLILYGPPGTGKTVLTQLLPKIIGFHLITVGLSAADFSKSLVGESSRMIRDLVNRATISPYILTSLAIDQVDGLVPDRKDKDQKNKGQGISMLLSVIGGNKDVSNLIFMTSTNYLKKIDQAIRRRLSGQYMSGRLGPLQRAYIILQKLPYLKDNDNYMDHIVKITTNFTGAALKDLSNSLLKQLQVKKMEEKLPFLSIQEINEIAITIARQKSITLGAYTLPQIYRDHMEKTFIFTQTFLKRISRHFLMIKHKRDNQFDIMYCNQLKRYNLESGKLQPYYEKQLDKVTIPIQPMNVQRGFQQYIEMTFPTQNYQIRFFKAFQNELYIKYKNRIQTFLKSETRKKKKLIILQDHQQNIGDIIFSLRLFQKENPNLYIIFYLLPFVSMKQYSEVYFGNWNLKKKSIFSKNQYLNNQFKMNYDGNIMVELNEQSNRMAFRLKNTIRQQSKVAFKFFLRSEQNTSPKSVIPELIDFFTKQSVNYILMITYSLPLQNDAFQQKKIFQVLEEKMMEAMNYENVAVIIDLDSLVLLSQNGSDSNFGYTTSYSIQNNNIFLYLLNYMKQFAMITHNRSKWMTILVKHPQLIKIVKKQLDWPFYPQQIQKMKQQQQLMRKKRCFRCHQVYTQKNNLQQPKCRQHNGLVIDTHQKRFLKKQEIEQKKIQVIKSKNNQNKNQNQYLYACCFKGILQQGCHNYCHIQQNQFDTQEDEVQSQKILLAEKWNQILRKF